MRAARAPAQVYSFTQGFADAEDSVHIYLNLVVSKETRDLVQSTQHCFLFTSFNFHFTEILPFPKILPYFCLSCICVGEVSHTIWACFSIIEMDQKKKIWLYWYINLSLAILHWLNQGCLYLTFISLSLILFNPWNKQTNKLQVSSYVRDIIKLWQLFFRNHLVVGIHSPASPVASMLHLFGCLCPCLGSMRPWSVL